MKFSKYQEMGDYHWAEHRRRTTYGKHADNVRGWITERSVLDVGGGDGLIAHLLELGGHDVLVVDDEPEAVMLALSHHVPAVLCSAYDVERLGRWDAVYCGDTLEHLDDPGRAVEVFGRVAPVLYLATPPRRADGELHDHFHVLEWTADELRLFLSGHGWRETSSRTEHGRILSRSERA